MASETWRQFCLQALSARRLLFLWAFLGCIAGAALGQATPAAQAEETPAPHAALRRFALLTARAGWLLAGEHLYRTDDAGDSWQEITPVGALPQKVVDVYFRDETTGWVLLFTEDAPPRLQLARTADGGRHWETQALALPGLTAAENLAGWRVTLADARTGWIAARLATGSNFTAGRLWQTVDGGATWRERTMPAGGPLVFADAMRGWAVGGALADELWQTADGGRHWQRVTLPETVGQRRLYLPLLAQDGRSAILPVLVRTAAGQQVERFVSRDGGATWLGEGRQAAAVAADPRGWLAGATGQKVLPTGESLPAFANPAVADGQQLVVAEMATLAAGWGLAEPGRTLLRTADGGATWQPLSLPLSLPFAQPPAAGNALRTQLAPDDSGTRTSVAQGAAFDICDLPFPGELSAWFAAGPYRIVNLYLGGVMRFCANENLTAPNVDRLAGEGWKFIPTWVGPQAPCSGYRARFSAEPAVAAAQGREEAEAALAAAQALGLAEADGAGTVVYYDLESFDGEDAGCVAAARAFVSGWVARIHERNSQAGLYGSACNPRMASFADLPVAPDAVWVAQWNRGSYDPAMTVWGIACLDDTLWSAGQRIRQYTPGHDETWGGITLNVDSNVLDSIVADPHKVVVAPEPVVTLETPVLAPPYADGMCGAGWHLLANERGYPAYYAANWERSGTIPPPPEPLTARWEVAVPEDGYYRVEAFIPAHAAIEWQCPAVTLPADTATATYTVVHADGTLAKQGDQAAHAGSWLLLGIFPLRTEMTATVTLETVTLDPALARTVAASALRLQRVDQEMTATDFVYLPAVGQ